MSLDPAPIKNTIVTKEGLATTPWASWFDSIGGAYLPYHKFRSVIYKTTATLTSSDLGKVVKAVTGGVDMSLTLPHVGLKDIDSWIKIMRLGTGVLTIVLPDSDTCEKSTAGGKMVCSEAGRISACLDLYLALETKWAIIGGTGIWDFY